MQVTESIHALKIPFTLRVGPDKTVDRFVFAYLIFGDQICLIDSGVAGAEDIIFDYIRQTGREPGEIAWIVFTHSHADHIGGGRVLKKQTGCKVAAHIDARPWIENVERQYEERPIGNFYDLVGGSVDVDRVLRDGDRLDLGEGQTLDVFHTPGHSRGSISLLYNKERALFTGDAVPKSDTVPIYEDVATSVASIKKLKEINGLEVLMASWDDPQFGAGVYPSMDQGLRWFQQIHEAVLVEAVGSDALDPKKFSAGVLKRLGFAEIPLVPIVVTSIGAHLKLLDHHDLMAF
jgi:glyoxylase-like metal-dependent hydrolase (beta-lactamase superfamily II)